MISGFSTHPAPGKDRRAMFTAPSSPMHLWQEKRARLEAELGERITLDALTGPHGPAACEMLQDDAGGSAGWLIAQRKGGHRHSVDDVLTAWYALQNSPPVGEHFDLGTGIGTVGLLTLWGMGPQARLTCVEAQEISYQLLQANLDFNGLRHRVNASHGDLRELDHPRRFPLVTGSPPYFPEGTGVLPQDSQKAHARFELRGDVGDYARAAARLLSPGGWFVLCFPAPQKQRALDGIAAAGLGVVRLRDVIPRVTLPPLFTLFACRHRQDCGGDVTVEPPFTVRHAAGGLTPEMEEVRRGFGFGPGAICRGDSE
jgi:tRNA1(Val) A37 N6-methylase TrmN6